ncbi:MAG TPA: glycosyltransferase [Gemmatimonadaceae bacterium]|nr:glycosyltransferase [Gemmatimonadaceae bacterium]
MLVSVVVCTSNRAAVLRRALEHLRRLAIPPELAWELLIVDNNGADDTEHVVANVAAALPVRMVREPRPGLSHARNRAIDEAGGDYVIWIDDDVLVEPQWLAAYVDAFGRWPDAALFGGPIAPQFDARPPRWARHVLPRAGGVFGLLDLGPNPVELEIEGLRIPFGGNFAMRVSELRQHRFDPRLGRRPSDNSGVGEEIEVMEAVLGSGASGWWVPAARVRHCLSRDVLTIRSLRRRLHGYGAYMGWRAVTRGQGPKDVDTKAMRRRVLAAECRYILHLVTGRPARWIEDLIEACETRGELRVLAAAQQSASDRNEAGTNGEAFQLVGRADVVRIASWPHWYRPNRVLDLMYAALEPFGTSHIRHVPLGFRLCRDGPSGIDVAHLHWMEPYWREPLRSAPRQLFRVARLALVLARAKLLGIRIVWSVHNLQHLDGVGVADRVGYRLLHRLADVRVFTSESARRAAVRLYGGATRTLVVPHGNYDGARVTPRARALILDELALSSNHHLLVCFGDIRPYKGFDVAIAALDWLSAERYHLVVAGRPSHRCATDIAAATAGRRNLTVLSGQLDEQRLADLVAASDLVLLPYRQVTGSGALLYALTHGRAVVATDLPYFREILSDHPEAGVLVPMNDAQGLAAGIERLLAVPPSRREYHARSLASRFSWNEVVLPLADWIRSNAAIG